MNCTKENYRITALREQAVNAGQYLTDGELVLWCLPVIEERHGSKLIFSWKNAVTEFATGDDLLKIEQYLEIYKKRLFHFLLFDGSLVRFCYKFEEGILTEHHLLWWPCPIRDFIAHEIEEVEVVMDTLEGNMKKSDINMRSPIRIDFGEENESHPMYHLHTEHPDMRLALNRPMCINGFMRFILENFYPQIKIDFSDWEYIDFKTEERKAEARDFLTILHPKL